MLVERYERDLAAGFVADPAQRQVLLVLEELRGDLMRRYEAARMHGVFHRFARTRRLPAVRGLYVWGGVGRGKTYLMDLFYESLPFRRKMRSHFNRFMQRVHQELRQLPGEADPLEKVADRIAQEAVLICFDEFFVDDITDAMLLGMLFKALFARGVTLVATSNIPPDRLYERGLQRERFLPAIAMLQEHCRVLQVDAGTDYRLQHDDILQPFCLAHDQQGQDFLASAWQSLTGLAAQAQTLEVLGRPLPVHAVCERALWVDFHTLCLQMRSQNDYIELARVYPRVLLQGVPILTADLDDGMRRFIHLVDEFYDRRVKLLMTMAAPLTALYVGQRLAFEFRRTLSRLTEMQSRDYLELEHRP